MAVVCVFALVLSVATVTTGPRGLVSPAAADPPPPPVQSASTSGIGHNVVVSPHGSWHAVLVDRGSATQRFLISSDGSSWQSVPAPRATSPWVASFAINDNGELYAIATDTSVQYYSPTDFWKYTGSWSAATVVGMGSSYYASGAGEIVTDGSSLVIIEAGTGRMFKSGDDGATWSTAQSLANGFSAYTEQTIVVGGVIHFVQVSSGGQPFYQRWDIATAQPLAVDRPPVMPLYQWSPYIFAAPGDSSTLYIAALDRSGGLFVYKTANSGGVWVTMVASDPFPAEFGAPIGFTMRADGRIDAFASSFANGLSTVLEVSHPTDRLGGWSSVTALATVPGDSASVSSWPTQRADAAQPALTDAWVSVPHGSSTYDLYWLTTPGSTVPPAAATAFTTSGSTVRVGLSLSTQFGVGTVTASPGRAWEAALVADNTSGTQSILRSQDGANWLAIPNPSPNALTAVSVDDNGEVQAVAPAGPGLYYRPTNIYRWTSGRWYGPITYAWGTSDFSAAPGAIIRAGKDLIGIESPTGRISYSTDDGNNWTTYPALSGAFNSYYASYTVVDSILHILISGNGAASYARWSRTARTELPVTTPSVAPSNAAMTLLPDRSHDNELWLSFFTSDGKVGLDHSVDNGANWTTVDAGSALPGGFTAESATLGGDGRLYVYGASTAYSTNLLRIDRGLNSSADWSATTTVDSQLGGTPFTAVPNAAAQTSPPGVWTLPVTPGSNPTTKELHHYGKLGGPVPIPDAQTYGPSTQPSVFAMRPQLAMSDPVSSATGSFTDQVTDAALPALGEPLGMTRTYNSADTTAGVMGRGWTFNYAAGLAVTASSATLRAGDGQQLVYTQNPDGSFTGPPGSLASLVKNIDGSYTATTKRREHYTFDSSGRLTGVTDRNNQGSTLTYDGGGRLSAVSGSGRSLAFGYDTAGMLASVTLPDGRYVGYTYTTGLLTDVRDLRGHHTTYAYDSGNRLASILDANSHFTARNTYDSAAGRVTDQYDARGNHTTFAWDAYTQTTTMTAPDGGIWRDVYNGNVLVRHIDPLGHATTFSYDAKLNLVAVSDPGGKTTAFSFDGDGNILTETDADGAQSSYTYNALDEQVTSVTPRGTQVTYSYDTAGNPTGTSRPNPAGGAITTGATYDPATGLLATSTDARGKVVQYGYNSNGDLTSLTDPLGNKTSYSYDGSGRRTSTVSPRGNVTGADPAAYTTSYGYDDGDELTSITDPLTHQTGYSYDNVGNRLTVTDANTHTTTYTYNETNQLATVQPPDPTIPATTYGYDVNDRLATLTRPYVNGTLTSSYGYDTAGQLTSATTPLGAFSYGYNAVGDRTTSIDPAGNTVTAAFDPMHRVTSLSYSDGTPSVTYSYNGTGNRTSMTDGSGTVSYGYDSLDRVTSVTRGTTVFAYGYDPAGHITSRTFPGQTADTFGFDDAGRLSTVTSGGTVQASYGYDPDSNLLTTTRPAGNGYTETRSYDNAGRLTNIADATSIGSTLTRAGYTLDPVGNPTAVIDAAGVTNTYRYDPLDRLTNACLATTTCTGATNYINWSYDAAGNRLTETRPGVPAATIDTQTSANATSNAGTVTTPAFSTTTAGDVLLALVSSDGPSNSAQTETVTGAGLTWSLVSRANTQHGDSEIWKATATQALTGVTVTATQAKTHYHQSLTVVALKGATGVGASTQAGAATGAPTVSLTTTTTLGTGQSMVHEFTDTAAGKDLWAQRTTGPVPAAGTAVPMNSTAPTGDRWNLAAAEVTAAAAPPATTSYTYNTKNQLTQTSGPAGTTNYGYDTDGNQTTAGTNAAVFNAAGKMTSSTTAGATTSYRYDGNGRRLSETTGTATTQLLWDPISYQLAEELDGTGTLQRRYTYGNQLISMTPGAGTGGPFYYHTDGQGSTLAITDAAGATQWRYAYEAYGTVSSTTKVSPTAPINPIGWTGQYTDPPTSSTLLRARNYNPATGRFTSPDPAGTPDTYGYGNQNPLSYSDPAGTDPNDPFSNPFNPEGGELLQAEQMACDAGLPCNIQQDAAMLYGGAQIVGMVANNSTLKCIGGKGSCAGTALNIAIFAAGSFDGGDAFAFFIKAEQLAKDAHRLEELEAAAGSGIDATRLTMTRTVEHHLGDITKNGSLARPYGDSRLTIQGIMDSAKPIPDPGGVPGALRWDVPGGMNGSSGTWQLVVDPNTNTILHFLFVSGG